MTKAKGEHHYTVTVNWTGNTGTGTSSYAAYSRDHVIQAEGKPDVPGSSDPAFRGDPARWNPEDMLVASLSACHKLWYLHFCAVEGIAVLAYRDEAHGVMAEDAARGGAFTRVTLRPEVTIRAGDDAALAAELHDRAHHFCFIANSVNFPVHCEPRIEFA
ncbi:OsmC family protein [Achromobacter sp. Bel]|uniref:OsmC family protein n=1 Tax=Achromobacter sp. Bel TaxID=2727415 RepID=UPI00145CE164|nr:OsmC family protein [Achromobacter sp. Bel]NMK48865.1 OsmC family protein [Achromobacter sp. Bel]